MNSKLILNNCSTAYGPVNVSGSINGNVGGMLTVVWPKPGLNHGLQFKCMAMGVDKSGFAIKFVESKSLDVDNSPLFPATPRPNTPTPTSGTFPALPG